MKMILISLLLFVFCVIFSQQKRFFVKDSLTQEGLPFAAVQFADKQRGIYGDERGQIIIPDSVQEVFISQIAYETKRVDMRKIENNSTIFLSPIPISLPDVIVSNRSFAKRKEIGCLNKKGGHGLIANPNTNFALYIPYDSTWTSPPYILSIISYLDSRMKGTKEHPCEKCNIRFDLRLPNKEGKPSDISLIRNRITNNLNTKYSGKEEVKILEPVIFPKEGVFIVIDFITPNNTKINALISPSLNVTGSEKRSRTWSRTITNDFKWKRMDKNDPAWKSVITQFYGENGIMNLRAGLEIVY